MIENNISRELITVLSGHGRRCIAMLWAYLDEAGTHRGAPILSVAGYLGSEKEWHKFEKDWSPKLKKANVPYFHAIAPECSSLKLPLAAAITKRELQGVICSLNPNEYKLHASNQYKSLLGNAYAICAFGCGMRISRLAQASKLGPVSIVLEDGQPNIDHVEKIFKILMKNSQNGIAGVMVAKKDEFMPLQTADFLSHVSSTDDQNDLAWFDYLRIRGNVLHAELAPEQMIEVSQEIKKLYNKQRWLKEREKKELEFNSSKI